MQNYKNGITNLSLLLCLAGLMSTSCGGRYDVTQLRQQRNNPPKPFSCGALDQATCHQDDRCQATYEIAAPCAQGPCDEVNYLACIDRPTAPICDLVNCNRQCEFGYAADSNGCQICACLPPMISCEEMNEAQCEAVENCRGLYRSSAPDSDRAPCPPDDPDCGRLAPPRQTEFVSCHPFEDNSCESNFDCPGGYCEMSTGRRLGPPGDMPENQPAPTTKQCIYPECNDGSILTCEAAQPLCERGSIATIRNNCWACVDENSCGDEMCEEPPDVKRTYASRDPNVCRQLMGFVCSSGEEQFSDDCGCGCQTATQTRCPPASVNLIYVSRDPLVCARINYSCDEGFSAFSSECGCGCIRATSNPMPLPSPTLIYDCGEGTETLCDAVPPSCASGTILTVRDGCWACISPEQCNMDG